MHPIRFLLPIIILLFTISGLSTSIFAEGLFKWKDARGHIQYGDKPPKNVKLERLDIPELTVIQNYSKQWELEDDNTKKAATKQSPPKASENKAINYERFTFIAPKINQVIHTKEGDVSAMLSIRPNLKKGHSIIFNLDGKKREQGKTRITNFSGLSVGNHLLSASIVNAQGKLIQKTSMVNFRVIRFNSAYSKKKSK